MGKMEEQLKPLGCRNSTTWWRKSKRAGADVNSERRKRVDALKREVSGRAAKLSELKQRGARKWDTLKTGVETAWSDLEAAFKKMKN